MTTLTERLRELEAEWVTGEDTISVALTLRLAQELHALLVECGEAVDGSMNLLQSQDFSCKDDIAILDGIDATFTKLKQAGIV